MKKTLLITTIICGMMAAGTAFSQHTQSLSFLPSGTIFNQNDTFTLDTFLTFGGYSSPGLSYWLETAPGTQSFFSITAENFLTFTDPNHPFWPNNFDFVMTNGVDTGYFATHGDLARRCMTSPCLYRLAPIRSRTLAFRSPALRPGFTRSTRRAPIRVHRK